MLLGIDFTIMTPGRDLAAGRTVAVDNFVGRLADKFQQIYSSLQWRDPDRSLRWLPLVVFVSPTASSPGLLERVHAELVRRGAETEAHPHDLMTCHAPPFLDLLELTTNNLISLAESVVRWRDGSDAGTALDWWLADHDALSTSTKRRIGAVTDWAIKLIAEP